MMETTPTDYCLLWVQWWPMCNSKSEWAAWTQGVGSLLAVGAAIWVVAWQLHHDRQRQAKEDVRRLQMLWNLVYHARAEMDFLCAQPLDRADRTFAEPRGLGHHVRTLQRIEPMDVPRADAYVAVLTVIESWEGFQDGVSSGGDLRAHANAAQDSFHFAEKRLRTVLRMVGADIPPARLMINGEHYPPLDPEAPRGA